MDKPKPLQSRIHTLTQMQLATLDLIRKVRFQLQKSPLDEGMTDQEFLEQIVDPLEEKIYADRQMAKIHRTQDTGRRIP